MNAWCLVGLVLGKTKVSCNIPSMYCFQLLTCGGAFFLLRMSSSLNLASVISSTHEVSSGGYEGEFPFRSSYRSNSLPREAATKTSPPSFARSFRKESTLKLDPAFEVYCQPDRTTICPYIQYQNALESITTCHHDLMESAYLFARFVALPDNEYVSHFHEACWLRMGPEEWMAQSLYVTTRL